MSTNYNVETQLYNTVKTHGPITSTNLLKACDLAPTSENLSILRRLSESMFVSGPGGMSVREKNKVYYSIKTQEDFDNACESLSNLLAGNTVVVPSNLSDELLRLCPLLGKCDGKLKKMFVKPSAVTDKVENETDGVSDEDSLELSSDDEEVSVSSSLTDQENKILEFIGSTKTHRRSQKLIDEKYDVSDVKSLIDKGLIERNGKSYKVCDL